MNKLFLSSKLSFKLKKVGFKEVCIAYYISKDMSYVSKGLKFDGKTIGNHNKYDDLIICSAPLKDQVVTWFREKHNIHIQIAFRNYLVSSCNGYAYTFDLGSEKQDWVGQFTKYNSAFNEAISEAIKLLK